MAAVSSDAPYYPFPFHLFNSHCVTLSNHPAHYGAQEEKQT
jgi:hypothetical protein